MPNQKLSNYLGESLTFSFLALKTLNIFKPCFISEKCLYQLETIVSSVPEVRIYLLPNDCILIP